MSVQSTILKQIALLKQQVQIMSLSMTVIEEQMETLEAQLKAAPTAIEIQPDNVTHPTPRYATVGMSQLPTQRHIHPQAYVQQIDTGVAPQHYRQPFVRGEIDPLWANGKVEGVVGGISAEAIHQQGIQPVQDFRATIQRTQEPVVVDEIDKPILDIATYEACKAEITWVFHGYDILEVNSEHRLVTIRELATGYVKTLDTTNNRIGSYGYLHSRTNKQSVNSLIEAYKLFNNKELPIQFFNIADDIWLINFKEMGFKLVTDSDCDKYINELGSYVEVITTTNGFTHTALNNKVIQVIDSNLHVLSCVGNDDLSFTNNQQLLNYIQSHLVKSSPNGLLNNASTISAGTMHVIQYTTQNGVKTKKHIFTSPTALGRNKYHTWILGSKEARELMSLCRKNIKRVVHEF